jgi:glutaredoxin 3
MEGRMIKIYSTTWCAFCHATKQYLDKLGVKYEDIDVQSNLAAANEMVQKSGQMGVPVIDIDGTIIVGFDRPRIDQTLKEKRII